MTSYYVLSPHIEVFGLVYPPTHDSTFRYRLKSEEGPVVDPPVLTWARRKPGRPQEWAGTVDAIRLLSPLARHVLDEHAGPADDLQWLPATVTTLEGEALPYWVLHFPTWFDLLDEEYTNWGPSGLPMRWVLARAKLDGHAVFIVPQLSDIVIVTDRVLDALRESGVAGYIATPARIA